jgi:ABC-type transport system involved in multi-copper enzyme maturation permease subunit
MVILTVYMAVLGVIAIAFLLQQGGPAANQSSQIGVQLFQVLAVFQVFLILFVAPASTAGAISGERQRQTWELLLVTRLSSFGIVWGKLLAGLAFNMLLIVASLPLFSLVFLFGGVAPDDVVHTYIVFLATVMLLGVTSLFVSALARRLAVAMIMSSIVALCLAVGVTLMAMYLENWGQPVYGPNGTLPPPPLTPLTHLDPLAALASALPNGAGGTILGSLGTIHHAFGLPLQLQLWAAYTILVAALSILLLAATTYLVRSSPRWLTAEGA